MANWDKELYKKKLLGYTKQAVTDFLTGLDPEDEDEAGPFYAFAYDCNAVYGCVLLCMNNEQSFKRTLSNYQKSRFGAKYQSEEGIRGLRYNTGDWKYQGFDEIGLLEYEEMGEAFDKDFNQGRRQFMEMATEALLDFMETDEYKAIPKIENFLAFCIDHDEDLDEALDRLEKLRQARNAG